MQLYIFQVLMRPSDDWRWKMLEYQKIFISIKNYNDTSLQPSLTFHYDSSFRQYGLFAKTFSFIGWFDGFPSGNISRRELVVSNLNIYENMDFHVDNEWFADFKEGLDERLNSAHFLTTLKQTLPDQMLIREVSNDALLPKLTLFHHGSVFHLGPEIIPISTMDQLYIHATSYVYHSSEYPAYCVVLAEYMEPVDLQVELPEDVDVW